ncbi:MAG: hypothetical protein KF836_14010 [Fimbriimonadaceae bacterium]|nr:hypothetical protein [Fimbriimonadaceae bacterium]
MKNILLVGALLASMSVVLIGCSQTDEGGDYKEPESGTYKTSEEVTKPGRERTEEAPTGEK